MSCAFLQGESSLAIIKFPPPAQRPGAYESLDEYSVVVIVEPTL